MASARSNPVTSYLTALHERFRTLDDGAVATYIPELGKADPRWFGICIATADGHVYEVGDAQQPFTVQSISKPFIYGLALEDRGKAAVFERIGVEPTGDAFNEISLEPHSGRPRNPMINAGAIAAAGLIAGNSLEDRWNRILTLFALYTGRPMQLNEAVYRSEKDTGHRNRAISHMLRNAGILSGDPEPDLDLYFRQCSIDVTARDLAVMAATLATGGINPITQERALAADNVDEVLSVMTTCGMYDYAGEWFYRIGFPAKSGVAGGILAVLPGQFGIGVFSPPLDPRGNSVRGVAVCAALSDELELHSLRAPRAALSALRGRLTLVHARSKRVRSNAQRDEIAAKSQHAIVYELQGDLSFSAMELIARRLSAEAADVRFVVLDLTRVREIDVPAARLLHDLIIAARDDGSEVALAGLQHQPRVRRMLDEAREHAPAIRFVGFDDLDTALEWCEERVLETCPQERAVDRELRLDEHDFVRSLAPADLSQIAAVMERREFGPGELVVREGDPAHELFLIVRGELSVFAENPAGRARRLSTLSVGMGFGESALVEQATRSAFVRADRHSVCWVLNRASVESLRVSHPRLALTLFENLLRSTWRIVDRLSRESLARTH
jgi:glutaminase